MAKMMMFVAAAALVFGCGKSNGKPPSSVSGSAGSAVVAGSAVANGSAAATPAANEKSVAVVGPLPITCVPALDVLLPLTGSVVVVVADAEAV